MARNGKLQKKRKPAEVKGGRVRRGRPKVCIFCAEHIEWVDYKDTNVLRRFINDRGRIKARGATELAPSTNAMSPSPSRPPGK